MRVPGDASLDFELTPARTSGGEPATRLVQTARFRPRGLLGLAYWYAVLPFHGPIFNGLIAGITELATTSHSLEAIPPSLPTAGAPDHPA